MAALQTLDERLSRTEPIVSSLSDCAPACVERAVLVVVPQLSLTHPLPILRTGISSFFTDLVPDYFSAALMGAGGAMLLVALVGCCSCGCCQVSAA